ncbi:hypothetical protein LTR40_004844 [Exophiala xenobiotica]|nr:hypothetical protein LTR40_004844 [Exophiala xenobiotica]
MKESANARLVAVSLVAMTADVTPVTFIKAEVSLVGKAPREAVREVAGRPDVSAASAAFAYRSGIQRLAKWLDEIFTTERSREIPIHFIPTVHEPPQTTKRRQSDDAHKLLADGKEQERGRKDPYVRREFRQRKTALGAFYYCQYKENKLVYEKRQHLSLQST